MNISFNDIMFCICDSKTCAPGIKSLNGYSMIKKEEIILSSNAYVPVALCVSQDPWLLVLALCCVLFLCIPTAAAEKSASQLLISGNRFLQAPLAEGSCRLLADSFSFWLQFIIHPPTALCDTSSHSLWPAACSLL
jgi:hypothetical protein